MPFASGGARSWIVAVVAAAGCSCGGGGPGPAPDTTPPVIIATLPAPGAGSVQVGTIVTLTASEPLDPASVTPATFTLRSGAGAPVAGAFAAAGATATFTPAAPLAWGTSYTATATGLRDRAGNALATPYAWTFTTAAEADATPPAVLDTSPGGGATGVDAAVVVSVAFSEAMDPATITSATFSLATVAGVPVAGDVAAAGGTATFTPAAPLAPATTYRATILPGASDLAGNGLPAAHAWTFTTAAAPDVTAPSVVDRFPAPGAEGVPTTAVVVVTFSEDVQPSSVSPARLALRGPGEVAVPAARSVDGAVATLTPDAPLVWATTFSVVVRPGILDLAGNALDSEVTWTFTTAAVPDEEPPALVAVAPPRGAGDVPVTAVVRATFGERVDPASAASALTVVDAAARPVAGSVLVAGAEVTFVPAILPYGATLTARVDTAVTDVAGNPLAAPDAWSFSTEPLPPGLDPTFGWSGAAAIPGASAAAIAADGLGRAWVVGGRMRPTGPEALLARLDADGALDPAFGDGGLLAWTTHRPNPWGRGTTPEAIALAGGGAYVAGQGYQDSGAVNDLFVAAVTAAGTLDPAFGAGGVVQLDAGGDDYARDVAVQADGKVVVLANSCFHGDCDVILLRYLQDGGLDPGFGASGMVRYSSAAWPQPWGGGLALDAGRILVAGREGEEIAVFRFLPGGDLDPSFGASGVSRFDAPLGDEVPGGVAALDGGAVLCGGRMGNGFDYDVFTARLLAGGALDPAYGTSGVGRFGMAVHDLLEAFAAGDAGQAWLAGSVAVPPGTHAAVLKVAPGGALDATFASAGWLLWRAGEAETVAEAIAVAPDGAVLVAATAWTTASPPVPERRWLLVGRLR